ncbi:hypothetical protein GWI33_004530 [Rhynchophorus ferrugineus]|uniref:Uncharacterized protein n=1 Tax=Rhynchophorus ferrugineus TaxID=354439 RepID=A0A834IX18_RHYFE|nr:hypothetical protein GWI33_004530 [Rhynchophorus ferrugineus]
MRLLKNPRILLTLTFCPPKKWKDPCAGPPAGLFPFRATITTPRYTGVSRSAKVSRRVQVRRRNERPTRTGVDFWGGDGAADRPPPDWSGGGNCPGGARFSRMDFGVRTRSKFGTVDSGQRVKHRPPFFPLDDGWKVGLRGGLTRNIVLIIGVRQWGRVRSSLCTFSLYVSRKQQ